jgi:2-dehydropantoate 2-reductase
MRIAIIGAGGIGGFYGGRLAQAGHEVTFIARGEHLKALRSEGLLLVGPDGDARVSNIGATDDPGKIEPVDVALFCVKLFDTEDAAQSIVPLLAKGGVCISLQNGVDGPERISAILGQERVMGGIAFASAAIEAPGVIRYNSKSPSIKFGENDGRMSERATHFRDACNRAGFNAEVTPDIRAALWHKFVGLTVNAALTCLVRQPAGAIYPDPDLIALARQGFQETADVGRALGVQLPDDIVDWQVQNHLGFPAGMYASMYHDLARGKRLEIESLSGLVSREGAKVGISTPFHTMAYACLKPYVNGTPSAQ